MTNKTFTIKGVEIETAIDSQGRKGISHSSMMKMIELIKKHGDSIRQDKGSIALAEYLKNQ